MSSMIEELLNSRGTPNLARPEAQIAEALKPTPQEQVRMRDAARSTAEAVIPTAVGIAASLPNPITQAAGRGTQALMAGAKFLSKEGAKDIGEFGASSLLAAGGTGAGEAAVQSIFESGMRPDEIMDQIAESLIFDGGSYAVFKVGGKAFKLGAEIYENIKSSLGSLGGDKDAVAKKITHEFLQQRGGGLTAGSVAPNSATARLESIQRSSFFTAPMYDALDERNADILIREFDELTKTDMHRMSGVRVSREEGGQKLIDLASTYQKMLNEKYRPRYTDWDKQYRNVRFKATGLHNKWNYELGVIGDKKEPFLSAFSDPKAQPQLLSIQGIISNYQQGYIKGDVARQDLETLVSIKRELRGNQRATKFVDMMITNIQDSLKTVKSNRNPDRSAYGELRVISEDYKAAKNVLDTSVMGRALINNDKPEWVAEKIYKTGNVTDIKNLYSFMDEYVKQFPNQAGRVGLMRKEFQTNFLHSAFEEMFTAKTAQQKVTALNKVRRTDETRKFLDTLGAVTEGNPELKAKVQFLVERVNNVLDTPNSTMALIVNNQNTQAISRLKDGDPAQKAMAVFFGSATYLFAKASMDPKWINRLLAIEMKSAKTGNAEQGLKEMQELYEEITTPAERAKVWQGYKTSKGLQMVEDVFDKQPTGQFSEQPDFYEPEFNPSWSPEEDKEKQEQEEPDFFIPTFEPN
jgi:hypothetical protein